jgi:hypothetical protein
MINRRVLVDMRNLHYALAIIKSVGGFVSDRTRQSNPGRKIFRPKSTGQVRGMF